MISQTVEYSLRAVILLASRYDEAMTVREIAERARIPGPYLSKLMKNLVRANIVQSRRGLGGGFKLAGKPEDISIWDIIEASDNIGRIHSCPLEIEGHTTLCPLHRRIDMALAQIEKAFRESTLDEILKDCGDAQPLCSLNKTVVELLPPQKNLPQKTKENE